jgi:hypothetical protein
MEIDSDVEPDLEQIQEVLDAILGRIVSLNHQVSLDELILAQ